MVIAYLGAGASTVWYAPQWLSYYSPIIGGLRGADAAGMEATYYWDALDAEVLDWLHAHTRDDETIEFAAGSKENLTLMRRWGVLRRDADRHGLRSQIGFAIQNRNVDQPPSAGSATPTGVGDPQPRAAVPHQPRAAVPQPHAGSQLPILNVNTDRKTGDGRCRWYVLQRRPTFWSPQDRWLVDHERPAFSKTIRPPSWGFGPWRLDVPLILIYSAEQRDRAASGWSYSTRAPMRYSPVWHSRPRL